MAQPGRLSQPSNGIVGKITKGHLISDHAHADSGRGATQDLILSLTAAFLEYGIELGEVTGSGKWHHKSPPGEAHHPLNLAFVIPFVRTTVSDLEHIMRLYSGKQDAALADAIAEELVNDATMPVQLRAPSVH